MRNGLSWFFYVIVAVLVAAPPAQATLVFIVSNEPDTSDPEGTSNLNIQTLASLLTFSNVNVTADVAVSVVDEADLSIGRDDRVTAGSLRLNAPTVNLEQDITLGSGGLVFTVNATTVNLTGRVFFEDSISSGLMGADKLSGTATQVNVLADTASIEQAALVADALGTVSVLDGLFEDVSVAKSVTLKLLGTSSVSFASGVLDASELLAGGSAIIEISGSGFEVDTGGGFAAVPVGALSALTGTLRGTLSSGDPFEVAFSQGGGSYTGSILLVPEPSTAALLAAGLLGLVRRPETQS